MKSPIRSRTIYFIVVLAALQLTKSTAFAQLKGNVFKDFNSNGQRDLTTEIGIGGIMVTVFTTNGSVNTRTLNDGSYSFSAAQLPPNTPVRVEFSELNGYFAGIKGVQSNSTVLFVNSGENTDASLGILDPNEYCDFDSPNILTTCYVNGDPLGGGSAGEDIALVSFPYTAEGLAGQNGAPEPTYVARVKEVGSTWGLTYQVSSRQYLTAALVRRHSGLGSLGTGGLYLVDAPTNAITPFMNVQAAPLFINTGVIPHVNLPADKLVPNEDSLTIHAVAKTGIGAMTLSQDQKTVYFVNLFDKKLYSFEVGVPMTPPTDASTLKSYNIPDPMGLEEHQPWAVSTYRGNIYVGIVNSAQTSQDTSKLKAYVYKLDIRTGLFSEVISVPMSYKRGPTDFTGECVNVNTWRAWSDVFPQGCAQFFNGNKIVNFVMNPQPILSSIAFDADGSMLLGFMDRFGLFAGYRNLRPKDDGMLYDGFVGGDILRAQYNFATDDYTLESNGKSGSLTGGGAGNNEGPGGGEFFGDDVWKYFGQPAHNEITSGGILVLAGLGEIMVSAMDPVDEIYQSGGVRTFNNTDGKMIRGFALYSDVPGTLGKSGGIGEIRIDCEAAAIEIGNRIWDDKNFNGIQDPDETGVNGVTVELYDMDDNATKVSTITTQNGGIYCFNSTNTPSLDFYRNYEIRLVFNQDAITDNQFVKISPKDNDPSNNGDERDSDGELIAGVVTIPINSGFPGQTAHKYDVGLIKCEKPNSGADIVFCAPTDSTKFPDVTAGQTWNFVSGPATAQIDPLTGKVTGMTASGEYNFALVFEPAGLQCSDTVTVTIKPLPDGGADSIGNNAICLDQPVIKLTAITPDGNWSAANNNPTSATIDADGNITGFTAVGTYVFIYELNQCVDSVKVEIKDCSIGQIGDFVWADTNDNGIQDSGENGVKDVTVELYKVDNQGNPEPTSFKTVTTGDNGEYLFDKLPSGSYKVRFVNSSIPAGTELSAKKGLGSADNNSDADPLTGFTDTIIIDNNTTTNIRLDIDAAIKTSCVKPNAGVDITFCAPQASYKLAVSPTGQAWRFVSGSDDVNLDAISGQIDGMDTNGSYVFALQQSNLGNTCADSVTVTRKQKPNAGNDITGQNAICTTAGITKLNATPSGGMWTIMSGNPKVTTIDANGNVAEMTLAGNYNYIYSVNGCSDTVAVQAVVCTIPCTKPNAGADVSFCAPQATFKLNAAPIGYAWRLVSGSGSVELDVSSGQVNGMNTDGDYTFALEQSDLGSACADTVKLTRKVKPNAGNNITGIDAVCTVSGQTTLNATPTGGSWTMATTNPNGATINSSGEVTGAKTVGFYEFIYTLNGCSDTVKVEAADCSVGQIGDFVWLEDSNDNGIQDSGEPGVKDIKLQLCRVDANGDQIGNIISEVTTNASGKYLFDKLGSGSYRVKIVASSLPSETVITSKKGAGNNKEVDSDFNPQTLSSDVIVIDNSGSTNIILRIDAGLTGTCGVPNECLPITFKKLR
jgi:hypothetical protein